MKTLKILYKLVAVALLLNAIGAYAQSDTSFIKKSINFWKDPTYYFSKIDISKIPTKILIDKTYFTDDIFNYNGISKVKTGRVGNFKTCYNQLRKASFDTLLFKNSFDKITETYLTIYRCQKNIPIVLVNVDFNQIKAEVLKYGIFTETDGCLNDQNASSDSYYTERFFAASILDNRIHGDDITFILDRNFYVTNIENEVLKQIEIDFGDGSGFRIINWNEPLNVQYSSDCAYIEAILKFTVKDQNNIEKFYYSHFTFLRTGSSLVPDPYQVSGGKAISSPDPSKTFTYPVGSHMAYSETFWYWMPVSGSYCYENSQCENYEYPYRCNGLTCELFQPFTIYYPTTATVEGYILFNPNNPTYYPGCTNPKLRRPIVICDGFDPGNRKDWYTKQNDASEDPLTDDRGLYEIINGNNSKRYGGTGSAEVINKLQQYGYDIVVLDFMDGAGDIIDNADNVVGCFNDIINKDYRDNQTEENIFIGPSMGGLISRIALAKMEQNETTSQKSHLTGQWISFDSPHKGANIPIGMQWAVYFLSLSWLTEDQAMKGLNTLNTKAATQMLLSHYTRLGSETDVKDNPDRGKAWPHANYFSLQDQLENNFKYPNEVLRSAISNGGHTKLFPNEGVECVNLNVPIVPGGLWCRAYMNGNDDNLSWTVFEGKRPFEFDYGLNTSHQIGYDNAQGGFTDAQRTINYSNLNSTFWFSTITGTPYDIATFMVTASAYGEEVTGGTSGNVYKIWNDNEASSTHFDKIHNMPGDNEEHVRISTNTRDYIIDLLDNDQINIQRPRLRTIYDPHIHQNIYQPVSYRAYQTATFGSNDGLDEFIVNETADVNITASNSIIFKPGFQVKPGAKLKATISNVSNYNPSKSSSSFATTFDYSQPNLYAGVIHNYSSTLFENNYSEQSHNNKDKNIGLVDFYVFIYPNPVSDMVNIELITQESGTPVSINVFDVLGKKIQTTAQIENNIYKVDLHEAIAGIYFVHVQAGNNTIIKKLTLIK